MIRVPALPIDTSGSRASSCVPPTCNDMPMEPVRAIRAPVRSHVPFASFILSFTREQRLYSCTAFALSPYRLPRRARSRRHVTRPTIRISAHTHVCASLTAVGVAFALYSRYICVVVLNTKARR